MKESSSVIAILLILVGSAAATGSQEWTWFFVAMSGVLGATEWICVKRKGKTLSRMFGDMETKKKSILTGGILIFVIGLVWHLWAM